ncbi:hypothetical protein JOF53_003635 [Crossiella equi]|uniref:Lipoprotein n=1 Tax=Crossiella equi TaxID=130796 RepID=A0ABS5ADV2_9PSEU|nr:hypothetical protein [Crossiella equi]MBP2474763.1 hypothetical protein [Crossiella equi]
MRPSRRRLALVALAAVPAIAFLSACEVKDKASGLADKASSFSDKAKVCAEALKLSSLEPTAGDPEATKAEAKEKADRLIDLAKNVGDADVKGALTNVADHYTSVAKERVDSVLNVTKWAEQTVKNLDEVRKVCIG